MKSCNRSEVGTNQITAPRDCRCGPQLSDNYVP